MLNFGLKGFDFGFQGRVFFDLALQEALGQGGFFGQACGGEHVDVAEFVFGVGEIFHFHQAFVHQGLEAVVEPPYADAQLLSQLALGEVGVGLQQAHDSVRGVFLQLGLAAGHELRRMCLVQATAVPQGVGHAGLWVSGSDFC